MEAEYLARVIREEVCCECTWKECSQMHTGSRISKTQRARWALTPPACVVDE